MKLFMLLNISFKQSEFVDRNSIDNGPEPDTEWNIGLQQQIDETTKFMAKKVQNLQK